ncbi:MAG: hypothetical protein IJV70_07250 [Clostridia bacterium]|nr:hypothetical protein [Clostridia bacterium]
MAEKDPRKVKIGRKSRNKGARGEREAAAELEKIFEGSGFHRGRQYHGGPGTPDICTPLEGVHFEIKRTESLSLYPAMEQARSDSKETEVPVVMHRRSHKPWLVVVELDRLPELIRNLYPNLKKEEEA